MRLLRLALLSAWCLTAVAQSQPGDLRSLVRDSLRFIEKEDSLKDWNHSWHRERKEFDSSGKVTAQNTVAGERIQIDGLPVFRPLERNGQKLTPQELEEQDQKIRERLAEIKSAAPKPGKGGNQNDWVKEVGDALDFQLTGEETVNGRAAWVLACSPRKGYQPKNMQAKVFTKMNGRIWVDRADRELVKAEAETFDTVSIGLGLLGKVEKGTRFSMSRYRLNDGPWVLDRQSIRFGARVLLVKWIGNEIVTRHWNYHRR